LQEILIKKVDYFYKLYLRQLKRQYPEINNLKEVIDLDISESNNYNANKFSLSAENLENRILWDLDLQVLMILDFFRKFKGNNPFVKNATLMNREGSDIDQVLKENEKFKENGVENVDENDSDLNKGQNDYYYTFIELPVNEKVEILYFFCK